jgi:hypothetical protein
VRVAGIAVEAIEASVGRAEAGDWVGDGLTLVVADPEGRPLATTAATVRCAEQRERSWFAPRTANRCVWRLNTPAVTGDYGTPGSAAFLLRTDTVGRIYIRNSAGPERPSFNPPPNSGAELRFQGRGVAKLPIGRFDKTVSGHRLHRFRTSVSRAVPEPSAARIQC